nr:MAG TPA: hypothetical protein [Bacteriophage sp.]
MYLLEFGRYIINQVWDNSKGCGESYQFVIKTIYNIYTLLRLT